jgi:hypothetical protein
MFFKNKIKKIFIREEVLSQPRMPTRPLSLPRDVPDHPWSYTRQWRPVPITYVCPFSGHTKRSIPDGRPLGHIRGESDWSTQYGGISHVHFNFR